MKKMNDFENMCKELNERKVCNNQICVSDNEYICASNAVKRYANCDRNKLLKLKGEAITSDWWVYVSNILVIFSALVAVLTLIYTIFCQIMGYGANNQTIYGFMLMCAVIVCFIYIYYNIKKYQCVSKWRGYILVAIEELEESSKKW